MSKKAIGLMAGLIVWCALLGRQEAFAHGGGKLYLSNAPMGDFLVSAWLNPPQPQSNEKVHITIGLAGLQLEPILDAQIFVTILDNNNTPIASSFATTEQSINRLFYETDFPRLELGTYELRIEIEGIDDSVSFPFFVQAGKSKWWVYAAIGGGGVLTAVILMRSWRKSSRPKIKRT